MLGLRKTTHAMLGVDFSASSIKVLEVGRGGGGYTVEAFAAEPLPEGAVVDKEVRDIGAVGAALIRAVKRSGTRLRQCAMAVPSSSIIARTLRFPRNLSEAELEGQVQVEADQYIPYSIEDVSLDFQVLGETEGAAGFVDVMVVASRKENVESRIAVAAAAKLEVGVVDVEAYAIERAARLVLDHMQGDVQRKHVAVVDVGAAVTSVYVLDGTGVIYNREQDFGGRVLTEEIMRRYDKDWAAAGHAKIHGGLPADYEPTVLEPFKQNMVHQVQRLLQYFYATRPNDSIDLILLAGGCAAVEGVDRRLQDATGTRVIIGNPFEGMSLARKVRKARFENDMPAALTALGLAMRGFSR